MKICPITVLFQLSAPLLPPRPWSYCLNPGAPSCLFPFSTYDLRTCSSCGHLLSPSLSGAPALLSARSSSSGVPGFCLKPSNLLQPPTLGALGGTLEALRLPKGAPASKHTSCPLHIAKGTPEARLHSDHLYPGGPLPGSLVWLNGTLFMRLGALLT